MAAAPRRPPRALRARASVYAANGVRSFRSPFFCHTIPESAYGAGAGAGGIHPFDRQSFSAAEEEVSTEAYHACSAVCIWASRSGCSALSSCVSYGSALQQRQQQAQIREQRSSVVSHEQQCRVLVLAAAAVCSVAAAWLRSLTRCRRACRRMSSCSYPQPRAAPPCSSRPRRRRPEGKTSTPGAPTTCSRCLPEIRHDSSTTVGQASQ